MKKIAFCFILLNLYLNALFAQAPTWSVNENAYQYTMTFVAKLNVGGKQLIGTNDRVAAFVGSTCRGTAGLTYVASEANYYAYLTVFSNTQDEAIYFKLYDSATDKTTTVSKQIIFMGNEHKGDLFQSFSIAEPQLNTTASILFFGFVDIPLISSVVKTNTIEVTITDTYSSIGLKPIFSLSKGAKLFKNRIENKSGESIEDFSSTINYEVLSEDESTTSNYAVSLSQINAPTLFYKKDAVCYAGGIIKVSSKQEGSDVAINSNGKIIDSKPIAKGEALFKALDAGSYLVTIGKEWKVINIILKDK